MSDCADKSIQPDQAAAAMLATLVEMHGVPTRVERAEMLTACNIANLELSGIALICVSSLDLKTPAYIHFAVRRLKSRASHAKLLLGLWSARDEKTGIELKEAVGANHFANTFHQAAAIILQEATTDHECTAKVTEKASATHLKSTSTPGAAAGDRSYRNGVSAEHPLAPEG